MPKDFVMEEVTLACLFFSGLMLFSVDVIIWQREHNDTLVKNRFNKVDGIQIFKNSTKTREYKRNWHRNYLHY